MDWMNQVRATLAKYLDRKESTQPGVQAGTQEAPQTVTDTSRVHRDFEEVSKRAPREALASGIAHVFRSDSTPPFGQLVGHLFSQSNPDQKAALLTRLFSISPATASRELLNFLGKEVTPADAAKVKPEMVQKLASEAEKRDPSVIDRIGDFYADHPHLMKTLGIDTLTEMMAHFGGMLRTRTRGGGAS